MQKIKNQFLSSLHELKSVHCLALTALFIALSVALDLMNVRIWITPNLRFTLSSLLSASIGMLFGPVVAMLAGFCTDILGYLANPTGGAFFFGFTLSSMLSGLLYGLWLYPHRPSKLRVLGAGGSAILLCNILCNTLWLSILGGKALTALLPLRITGNLILLPFEIALLYFATNLVLRIYRRMERYAPTVPKN